ncbi:MAG: PAS domain S-box protein [Methanococcaceae archaeon]
MSSNILQNNTMDEIASLRQKNQCLEEELKTLRSQLSKEKFLATTLDSIRECVSITDMEDNLIYLNRAFLETYGFQKDDIIGKNISIVRSDKNDPELMEQILPSTLQGGWTGEIYNRKKDGTDFLISLRTSIVRDEQNLPLALVGASVDITEKKRDEELLRLSEENYRSLFEDSKDVVYVTSPEGRFIELNAAGLDLFGFASKEEMLQTDIVTDIYTETDARQKFKEKMEQTGFVKDYELVIKTKSGQELNVVETASVVKNKNGEVVAYRGILRDISFIKKAEAQLKEYVEELHQNKTVLENTASELEILNKRLSLSETKLKKLNSSKDNFFSILAHDLRSPFTSLIGLSSIIVSDCHTMSSEEVRSFAVSINKSAGNVLNLLENLLQWSRIQTDRMEFHPVKVDLHDVAEQTISLLCGNAVKKNIDLANRIRPGSSVLADKTMTSSIFQNIVTNAIKFTPKGGKIDISAVELMDHYEITITDSGVGISEGDLEKIFRIDVHHTTVGTNFERGSGLGLILCKELLEKNGGTIKVESQVGQGSSFIFLLKKFSPAP